MRRRASVVLLACALVLPAAAVFDDAGYEKAISAIRCDCGCHPQSVKDCACGRAAEMREEIRALMVDDGTGAALTGEAVIAKYVADHGEQILISPDASGFNLLAWLGPAVGLLAAILAMSLLLRRWKSRADEQSQPEVLTVPQSDAPYMSRLKRELEDLQ